MRRDRHGVRPRMLLRGRLTIAAAILILFALGRALLASERGAATSGAAQPPLADVAAFPQASGDDGEAQPEPDAVEPTLPPPTPPPQPAPDAAPRETPAARSAGAVPDAILRRIPIPPPGARRGPLPRLVSSGASAQVTRGARLVEVVPALGTSGPLRVEYTLDAGLTDAVYDIFARGRVKLGLAVVLDPASGEVLAYAGTDPERMPPSALYPAASLVKVVTAAAALQSVPGAANRTCRFVGSPYRLTPARLNPPRRGTEISLERALATSNNQCFAQLAVNDLGENRLLETFRRFGLLQSPGPGHAPGEADAADGDRFALGKLGCGLAGLRITGLHAAEIAATLVDGRRVAPHWIARVSDLAGHELALPPRARAEPVLPAATAAQLRDMMTETTLTGTARRAFHGAWGRPLLREMTIAGKTGSLSGTAPPGRYEWFIGLAPADRPKIAIAVLVVQQRHAHPTGAQVAAQVLNAIFCNGSVCRADRADQWLAARAGSSKRSFD
ncbi:MAG TPA: penicillin-binding transpeptidase domain-containing protein [Myxococcota bacterium]|nr:penicillin-binding transpeptidase domain-containing protein [Myxococcota bacterium]